MCRLVPPMTTDAEIDRGPRVLDEGLGGGTASPSQPRRPTDSHALKCRRLSATTTRVMAGLDNRGIVTV